MITIEAVSGEKLRGGFYSPDLLVDLCLSRVDALTKDRSRLRLLEPSVGDGAFVRGLDRHRLRGRISEVAGVELVPAEAARAAEELRRLGIQGSVTQANVLEWNEADDSRFDVVVGNPPYVRFQFLSMEDRQRALNIGIDLGVPGSAVSNLWIPVLLLALARLAPGGAFSLIVPMEFMTGVAASRVRTWLLANTLELSVDLFKPGAFPAVLQEVVVLSGRRAGAEFEASTVVHFHDHNGGTRTWKHELSPAAATWTSYLLTAEQLGTWNYAIGLPNVRRLGDVARFSVSTVTGANDFFCVSSEVAAKYDLERWALPLLPRIKHAPGLVFDDREHQDMARTDTPAWLISFAADMTSPHDLAEPSSYISQGESRGLDRRFKCRVREPWFRVPVVPAGSLLLSKRSDRYPRVIVNRARVVTTDTIYRGAVRPGSALTAEDIASAFHNSLTLLSVEIGGRSFGGGVLELVPSEVASLRIPASSRAGDQLNELDRLSRQASQGDALLDATDSYLSSWVPELTPDLIAVLNSARRELSLRRAQRSHGSFYL